MVRNVKGFTMVELMIVIAIIGVLAVALIPTLTGAQAKARDTSRISGLTNAWTSMTAFATDVWGYPLSASGCLSSGTGLLSAVTFKNTAGNDVSASVQWFFANSKAPADPQGTSANTTAACSTAGSYGYQAWKINNNADAGIFTARVESSTRGNVTISSSYATGGTSTPPTPGSSGTGYVRVVTGN